MAAFAQECPHPMPAELTVRVYCLPDTDDAMAYVSESERRFGGRLLSETGTVCSLGFADTGEDLCFSVDEVGAPWACQVGADFLQMPFNHVWSCAEPSLHCSFTLRRCGAGAGGRPNANRLDLTVAIWQNSTSSGGNSNGNPAPKCSLLNISSDLGAGSMMHTYINGNSPASVIPSPYDTSPLLTAESTCHQFRISPPMMASLSKLLDMPNSAGNDWRLLAERLNVHR